MRPLLVLCLTGCGHRASVSAAVVPDVLEAAPIDELAALRDQVLVATPGGPDTGDPARLRVDLPLMLGAAQRVGVSDPYAVLNPHAGWVQVETLTFPVFNQVLVFRSRSPQPHVGTLPPTRPGTGMGLTQVTAGREAAGGRFQLRCLGEAGHREALERACDALLLRACG